MHYYIMVPTTAQSWIVEVSLRQSRIVKGKKGDVKV